MLSACGGNSGPTNINGWWFANLTDSSGTADYAFSATLTQDTGSGFTVTNFSFTTPGPCFSAYTSDEYSESGSFTFNGNSKGHVQGTFEFTVTTNFPGATNNLLTLTGNTITFNDASKAISGTWMASGFPGCSGSGTFTLNTPVLDPQ